MKYRILNNLVFGFFLIILLFLNIAMLTSQIHEINYFYIKEFYYFYIFASILDSLLLIILVIQILQMYKNLKTNVVIMRAKMILVVIGLILLWVEVIFSSRTYFGGIGNHQNLFLGSNNGAVFGSAIFSLYLLVILIFEKVKSKSFRVIFLSLGFLTIIFIHYLILILL